MTLRPIKPPVDIPDYWLWFWIAIGLLAAVTFLFLLWKYWLKKKLEPAPAAPLPPHIRARQKLNAALTYISEPKQFTVLVSDAIRTYLEERFDFHAPERTTEEFLHELQLTDLLADDQKQILSDFLSRCDLVKFAKYEPTQMELEELHQVALRIVDETEPCLNTETGESGVSAQQELRTTEKQ